MVNMWSLGKQKVGVALVVAVTVVSADHTTVTNKKTADGKHAEVIDKKKHHQAKSAKKYSHHDVEKSKKGKSETISHKVADAEKGGKKHHSVDEGQHHVAHHVNGGAAHKAAFKHGEKQKKTGSVKGYREQYHKDEHKKMDSFYSNKHKTGSWLKYGGTKNKHHSSHHDKDSHGKYQAAKHSEKYGKEKTVVQGHQHADHKGFKHEAKQELRKETPKKHETQVPLSKFEQYRKRSHS